ncbi:MAG: hypothetical protein ACRCVT_06895 [Leadbetterella sp.]
MVFTYHVVKSSFYNSIRAFVFPPNPKDISGLIHAEVMTTMKLGSGIFSISRLKMNELVLFAQWETESAIDNFLTNDKFGRELSKGWHLRLDFIRQWGKINKFLIPNVSIDIDPDNTPVVAITIARMKTFQIPRFIKWGRPVEKLVRDDPHSVLSFASLRLPRTVSTFSIWKSQKHMQNMVLGHSSLPEPRRHIEAMKERERKDFHFEFTTLRFLPIAEFGEWNGTKYLS